MLRIDKTEDGHCTVLLLDGELSYDTIDLLARKVEENRRQGEHHIVLDMSGVDFIDSSGAACLMKLRGDASDENEIMLAALPASIHSSLMRLGIINSYRVYRSPADAVLKLR